jgi:hypothetical protein
MLLCLQRRISANWRHNKSNKEDYDPCRDEAYEREKNNFLK